MEQLSTTRVEKSGLRQYGSTANTNTNYLNMQYRIKVSRASSRIIRAHLKEKATLIPSDSETSDTLDVNIENGDDLMQIFYSGMDMSDLINNPKEWYYSESDL